MSVQAGAIHRVSGALTDACGRPLACVQLEVSQAGELDGVLATDDLGRFAFGIPDGGSRTVTPQAPSDYTTAGITTADAERIVSYLNDPGNGWPCSPFELALADVDGDGSVAPIDSLILQNYIAGGPLPPRSPAWIFSPAEASLPARALDSTWRPAPIGAVARVAGPIEDFDVLGGMIGDVVASAQTWHCPGGCGDDQMDVGEQCDDGGNRAGDGCTPDCRFECGNGVIDARETCDDGNRLNGDGCASDCGVVPSTIFADRFAAAQSASGVLQIRSAGGR